MTRLERNRLKREKARRKYYLLLGILLCVFILAGGVFITNSLMLKMTAMPKEENLFYKQNLAEYVEGLTDMIEGVIMWLDDRFTQVWNHILQWADISGFS